MKIIVLKFGGTSIGSIQRIKKVSKIIKSYSKKYNVIVLSSAMSGTTNKLINMSQKISKNFATIIALESEPPLPIVVIFKFLSTP